MTGGVGPVLTRPLAPVPMVSKNPTPGQGDPSRLPLSNERLPILPDLKPLEGATIIARVGDTVVLEREVLGFVNSVIAENVDRIPPEKMKEVRLQLIEQRLKPLIETKLVVEDVRQHLPKKNLDALKETLKDQFAKREIKKILKRMKLNTRAELEAKLAAMGSSLDRERESFIDRTVAQTWVRQQLHFDEEISHDEMLTRYHENLDKFKFPAEAKWQELAVRFDRSASKTDAYRRIAELGNQVLAGTPFEQIARNGSDGATADDGGLWDWTSQGSLVSTKLDEMIFTLPVGRLSQIIEDGTGFHIIRVIDRHEAGTVPFIEAQIKIREEIREEHLKKETSRYLADLRERIPVWTIFDDQGASSDRISRPTSASGGRRL